MGKDYSGEDLRGRSFKGHDLSGADFSDAKLGGVDFSGANLNGAKFCRARMGHSIKIKNGKTPLDFLFSISMCIVYLVGAVLLHQFIRNIVEIANLSQSNYEIWITVLCLITIIFLTWWALTRQRIPHLLWPFPFSGILLIIFIVSWSAPAGKTNDIDIIGQASIIGSTAVFLILQGYLEERAILSEEAQLSLLRRWRLTISCFGGTKFTGDIKNADFSNANLQYVRFTNALLIGCIWKDATNLHLAQTRGSLLETRKVRELLTTGNSTEHDFSGMHLTGANFAGMDLRGFNFSNTNLCNADFSGSDLRDAILVATNVTGACFRHATLTGACIENWNIDARTTFDANTACAYVWLGPKKDATNNERERNPPEGEFKPGEFAKLYQQVADTIDFILHSRDELDAFNQAVAGIKANGTNIDVESVERKNDSVVVKLKASPDAQDAIREEIYAEVKKEFMLQLALAQNDVRHLQDQRDLMSTLLIGKSQNPTPIIIKKETKVIDKSRKTTLKNVTLTKAALSLGDHSTATNSIAQLPDTQSELKTLLTELSALIAASNASAADQKDAQQQTQVIAEAAQQAETPQPGRIRRILDNIQAIFTGIDIAAGTAEKIGGVATKIIGIFES